jgi:hypothetical protein
MANRVDAAHGQSLGEEVCEVPTCSNPNSRHFGLQAKAGNQSIRWKTSRVEAASPLHWGGDKSGSGHVGLLRKRRSKGDGFGASDGCASIRRMSRRSQDRRRKSGTLVKTTCATSSRRMVPREGACRRQGMSEVGGFRGEGSLSGNNAQRVSVQEHRKVRLKRELGFVKEHGFG